MKRTDPFFDRTSRRLSRLRPGRQGGLQGPSSLPDAHAGLRHRVVQGRGVRSLRVLHAKPPKMPVEGKFTFVTYTSPTGKSEPSALAVVRNYETAIRKVGGDDPADGREPTWWVNGKVVKDGQEAWAQAEKGNGKIWLRDRREEGHAAVRRRGRGRPRQRPQDDGSRRGVRHHLRHEQGRGEARVEARARADREAPEAGPDPQAQGRGPHRHGGLPGRQHEALAGAGRGRGAGARHRSTASPPRGSRATAWDRSRRSRATTPTRAGPGTGASSS